MKSLKFLLSLVFVASMSSTFAQSQLDSRACQEVQSLRMDFLTDGSFVNEAALPRNLRVLKACGLDEYDIQFFGRMNYMSGILRNLSQTIPLERLTYGDLMQRIEKIMQGESYQRIKKLTVLSEELGARVGNEQSWEQDLPLFEEIGASQKIIDAVRTYLQENPNNQKTYKEILLFLEQ